MEEYNILLVDDEDFALRGIENGVDWRAIGIHGVHKAHTMATAQKILQSHRIQIVLTDIEMPNGTGLDLIRWIKEYKPKTVCLFYTCHAEFSYAQMAVKLGVADYVLKPIPYQELQAILLREVTKLKQKNKEEKMMEVFQSEVSATEGETAIENVKTYIMEHISEDLLRDEIAKVFYMNPDYLSKLFKKRENMTIGTYITMKRMNLAAKLLELSNLSITEIGQRVGFSDISYFIKKFKQVYEITPQQYRSEKTEPSQN